jgi:hypothetical protein
VIGAVACSGDGAAGHFDVTGIDGSTGGTADGGGASGSAGASLGSGGAGNGGVAGTSGAGGSAATATSRRGACRAYVLAACVRRAECEGSPTEFRTCIGLLSECPDEYFSVGAVRTPADVLACATARRQQDCTDALLGITPTCALPGTRTTGQTCTFADQCASLSCSGTALTCGHCEALAAPGKDCTGLACPDGQLCVAGSAGSTCQAEAPPNVTLRDVHVRIPGEPCAAGDACYGGGCLRDAASPTGGRCGSLPISGEPCATLVDGNKGCWRGASCSSSGTCGSAPPCTMQCNPNETCACATAGCTSTECVSLREEGESCSTAAKCAPGTTCTSGRCVASDALTVFPAACGP